jgi:hypothetical protein
VKFLVSLPFLLLLFSCGYQFSKQDKTAISVPFIKGDADGRLTSELIQALTSSGHFQFSRNDGDKQLLVSILSDTDERIGYRYDRDPTTGERRKNIVGVENRETISVEIKLVDAYSHEIILGPEVITANADYDYVDYNSIRDLVTFDEGHPTTVIDFSLGQLDSIEGAHDDAQTPIFRKLAQKIVDGIMLQEWRKD